MDRIDDATGCAFILGFLACVAVTLIGSSAIGFCS